MEAEEGYVFDEFHNDPDREPFEVQFEKLKKFLDSYSTQLEDIEEALDENMSQVWDPVSDPIALRYVPVDQDVPDALKQIPSSGSEKLDKLVKVIIYLLREVRHYEEEAELKVYSPLSLVLDCEGDQVAEEEGLPQAQFARMLDLLNDVWNFRNRGFALLHNLIRQCASLYNCRSPLFKDCFKHVHLIPIFEGIGSCLRVFLTIDQIMVQNHGIIGALPFYQRLLRSMRQDPSRYGLTKEKLLRLERVLTLFEDDLLRGRIFDTAINIDFSSELEIPGLMLVEEGAGITLVDATDDGFMQEFHHVLRMLEHTIVPNLGAADEAEKRSDFVILSCLFVMFTRFSGQKLDRKLFQSLWGVHKKLPMIHLFGDTVFQVADFFIEKCPVLCAELYGKDGISGAHADMRDSKRAFLAHVDMKMDDHVHFLYLLVSRWMVKMESRADKRMPPERVIHQETELFVEGFMLACRIRHLLEGFFDAHVTLDSPINKSQVMSLCKCVQMVESIECTYHRRSTLMGRHMVTIVESVAFHIGRTLSAAREKLETGKMRKGDTDASQFLLGSLLLTRESLNAIQAPLMIDVLLLSHPFLIQKQFLKEQVMQEVRGLMNLLKFLTNLSERVKRVSNLSFLYFQKHLIPIYFQTCFEHPEYVQSVPYVMRALEDCIPMLEKQKHLGADKNLAKMFEDEITTCFMEEIVIPLSNSIDNHLRMQTHSVVLGKEHAVVGQVKDFSRFLKLRPIRFFSKRFVSIRQKVAQHLDREFYNHTSLTPRNWRIFEEMRNLAKEKYGLDLSEAYLPGPTLEQGLDLLQITRSIHLFVGQYAYDLNTQVFVERPYKTSSKHLNTVQIQQASSSIRTHGIGIMDTTVNFVYQFLGKKFFVFSQFLFDDHIKSPLIKEARFYKERRDELDQMYPVERAMEFLKGIRKLGLIQDKKNYIDMFRELITEIGNSLGYVRMVRSGALHHISGAVTFVPDLEDIIPFEETVKEDGLSGQTIAAARNLDQILGDLTEKFTGSADYFKIFVEVFQKEFQKEENLHLRNFYAIVPPLTLSFLDHIITLKDRMDKRGRDGIFSDDGFALGTVFILKVLDQNMSFDSLHWFRSLRNHYARQLKKVAKQMASIPKKKGSDDELQTLRLTQSRVEIYQREVLLLEYAFSGARVFFR